MRKRYRASKAIGLLLLFLTTLFSLFAFQLSAPVYAAEPSADYPSISRRDIDTVSEMEKSFYSIRYEREPIETRLNRLEETVFGEPQTGQSPQERINRLSEVFAAREKATKTANNQQPTQLPGIPPKNPYDNTPMSYPNPDGQASQPPPQQNSPQASQPGADETDYPTVTRMEQKVFNQTYTKEILNKRLDRLEKKVYGHSQNGTLVERVDALRLTVLGDIGSDTVASNSPMQGPISGPPGYGYPPYGSPQGYPQNGAPPGYYPNASPPFDYGSGTQSPQNGGYYPQQGYNPNYPSDSSYTANAGGAASSPDFQSALSQVEQQVLKHTYPMEPSNSRLTRLENQIFHQPAPPGMSDEDRLQRIISVAAAGGGTPPSRAQGAARSILPILLMILPLLL